MKTYRRGSSLVAGALAGCLIIGCATANTDKVSEFSNWPAGKSPREIGHKVATNMLPRWTITKPELHYAQDITWVYALKFAGLTGDEPMKQALIKRFDPFLDPATADRLMSKERHVDHTIFGIVPLEIYMQTKDERYLKIGKMLADRQWENPTPEGLSGETRYWIDDMYMITELQLQAYRATGDPVYLDRTALEMSAYLDKLQRPEGLFYHGPEFHQFWGRGNGWFAAGMAELLSELPAKHPKRARIMEGYQKMMAALLKHQDSDGTWHQIIDDPGSYKESSCTAMFSYAIITGVQNGLLDANTYAPAARKGWLALTDFVDKDGNVGEVCIGTGQSKDRNYYLKRPRVNGDPHGQAPTLWCVVKLLK